MSEKFKGRYTVADGYAGGDRPHYFTIHASDLNDDMGDNDLIAEYEHSMQSSFNENIAPEERNQSDFVEWAKEQIAKRSQNDNN